LLSTIFKPMEEFFDQLFLNCVRNLSLARSNRSLAKTALSFHAYEALALFLSGLVLKARAAPIGLEKCSGDG